MPHLRVRGAGLTVVGSRLLAVESVGRGPAVVFLHGLGGTSNVFQAQADALSARHRVVRLDFAGAGRSPVADGMSVRSQVTDVLAVLDLLGVRRATLVGHSMGTVTARLLAAAAPERVDGLVLLSPVGVPVGEAVRRAQLSRADRLRTGGTAAVVDEILRDSVSASTRRRQPVVVAFVRELVLRQDAEGFARSYEGAAEAPDPGPLPSGLPALVVAGGDDALGSPGVADDLVAGTAARVELLSDVGHAVPLEAGQRTTELVETFLAD